MKPDKWKGVIRELLMALAGGAAAWGLSVEAWWPEMSAAVLALWTVGWAIWSNAGWERVMTLVRKAVSASAGALIALGQLTPERGEAVVGIVMALVAVLWTACGKAAAPAAAARMLVAAAAGLTLMGCAGVEITPDGCALGRAVHEGREYRMGPCFAPTGAFRALRVSWDNGHGQRLRCEIDAAGRVSVRYEGPDGQWLDWDEKCGVRLGDAPPEARKVLVW